MFLNREQVISIGVSALCPSIDSQTTVLSCFSQIGRKMPERHKGHELDKQQSLVSRNRKTNILPRFEPAGEKSKVTSTEF